METTTGAVDQLSPDLSYAERDACLHTLGALHAAGKLSLTELDVRVEAALVAATSEELAALLPETAGVEAASKRRAHVRSPQARGWVFAVRWVAFAALALLGGLVRVLAVGAVALGNVVVRVLAIAASAGRLALLSVAGRGAPSAALGGSPRQESRRSTSQELVLAPRSQVPAQREPVKTHPVLVPSEVAPSSTDLVLANRSTELVPTRKAVLSTDVRNRDLPALGEVPAHPDRGVREFVAQLKPLVHRVTQRARSRRPAADACEQLPHAKAWQGSVRLS